MAEDDSVAKSLKQEVRTRRDLRYLSYSSTSTLSSSELSYQDQDKSHIYQVSKKSLFKPLIKPRHQKSLKIEPKVISTSARSVSRGTSPITTISPVSERGTNIQDDIPYTKITRAKLVRQNSLMEESSTSRSEISPCSTLSTSTQPPSHLSSSSDITDSLSLESLDVNPKNKRCLVTNL